MKFPKILSNLIHEAEKLLGKTGAEKKAFVLEQVAKLDDKTPLAIFPNELEEELLSWLVDYTVALVKKK